MTRERSTFTRRDVVQAFAEAERDGARVEEVERRMRAFLTRAEIVELEPEGGEPQYTTRSLLRIEQQLLDGADARRGTSVGVAYADAVDAALCSRSSMSEEQRALVEALTRSGDGVQVVRSAAGTGKTYALDAAAEAWRRSGVPVLGCGLSARAACELRDQAGIDAITIARLTRGLESGVELTPGAVLIVDEAGMVGTRDLAALADAANDASAKLVLVGDDRQLPEIQAGGAFHALAERLGAVELHDVRRQRDRWDREALAALRSGDVDRFARVYQERGRLVAAVSADAARAALVDDWCAAHVSGASALMIAHRRSDVADLNARARAQMRELGRIGADQLHTDVRGFAVGDRVVVTRNDHRLGVVNGEVGVLVAIEPGRLDVRLDDGRRVGLSERYARDGHLDHGYAITAHRAQGATVERAFVLGCDELSREWGYTALSRHRTAARFYVSATPTFLNETPPPLQAGEDVTAKVARLLAQSRAKHLAASQVRRPDRTEDERLPTLPAEGERTRWHRTPEQPALCRGRDPLAGIDRGHERGIGLEL